MAVAGLTCGDICRLFCCPPCPSAIASKLAFVPPKPTTYFITTEDDGKESLFLTERAEFLFSQRELGMIEAMTTYSRRRNKIACMHVKITDDPCYTLLFSHGNAVDLGQMSSYYVGLGTRLNCNVFGYDYSGYGDSSGEATESNVYADAEAAWDVMVGKLGIPADKIIIYGQSIGSVASVDLATRHQCAGVILHSALLSGMRVAFPETRRSYFFDPFPNINKIVNVQSVVLVIHGTDDEVIDFSHGLGIYERAPNTVDPLWIEGAGHNDIERYSSYLHRLLKFVNKELPARAAAAAAAVETAAAVAASSNDFQSAAAANGVHGNNTRALDDDGVMALAGALDNDSSGASPDSAAAMVTATAAKGVADKDSTDSKVQLNDDEDDEDVQGTTSESRLIGNDEGTARPASSASNNISATTPSSTDTPLPPRTASQVSLPKSVDCSDLAPSATPESADAAGMPAVQVTGGSQLAVASTSDGRPEDTSNLVYV